MGRFGGDVNCSDHPDVSPSPRGENLALIHSGRKVAPGSSPPKRPRFPPSGGMGLPVNSSSEVLRCRTATGVSATP